MREGVQIHDGHRRIWAEVIGVARTATSGGIFLAKDPMEGRWVGPLGGHVGVTGHAPVCHRGRTPEGDMAKAALPANCGM